ncbi:MAG: hypothetical protein JO306_05220 [Gemmatimonadetes bacterium]|nr:hypothetical protein [Gemmatimonadota bacterium]
MSLHISAELEQRIVEAAEAAGTTPDDFLKTRLSELSPPPETVGEDDSLSLADLLGDAIGMLDSREFGKGGSNASQESERRFKEILLARKREGHL